MSEAGRRWVMVNCTGDTLTDTASGGIANWILGVVRAASQDGATVPVVTKRHAELPSPWPHAVELSYPERLFKGSGRVDALLRRRTHFVHPRQPRWNARVLDALASVAPHPSNLLFHNDPELAAVVAEQLPQHRVWHLLHNTNATHAVWNGRLLARVRHLAVSDFVARWWEGQLDAPRGTVQTVYAGVDSTLFTQSTKAQPLVLSYVGLLNERKAPDLLLAACERIVANGSPVPFSVRIIGAKHYGRAEADAYTTALDAAGRRLAAQGVGVTFTGFLPRAELATALADVSINVVPSRWQEPFSLAVLEGMAAGAATIVTDRGGLPEAAGSAAVVVPGEDATALAEALCCLLADDAARVDLAHRGRQRATELTWSHTWQSLTSLHDAGGDV